MKLLNPLIFATLAIAASSTSNSMNTSGSASTASTSTNAAASTSTSPEYTITALPAVKSAPSCVFNCLIPIGLADSSGCDDVTEDCACLSAPADVLGFLTDCVNTVCQSSTSAFGASATSLYESYCTSVFGKRMFSQAFVVESSADAAAASSSVASVEATMTSSSSSSKVTGIAASSSPSATASMTAKSGSVVWSSSLLRLGMAMIAQVAFSIVL